MSLKNKRKAAGLTQRAAAEVFGLKYRTYQNYENGVTSPDMDTAAQFARYFNCSIGELFDLEEGSESISLSPVDRKLLNLASQLNNDGLSKLLEIADVMVMSGRYQKKDAQDYTVSDFDETAIALLRR